MISAHYHVFSCNVYMQSHDYISILWAEILVSGQKWYKVLVSKVYTGP